MLLRFTVIGLVVVNVFLWGWAAIQPEPVSVPEAEEVARVMQISGVPAIRLAREADLVSPGGLQASRQCYTLGPIESRSAMRAVQDELERSVVQLSWHETTAVVEQGYWVYLEPFSSRAQAAEAVQQLVDRGISDYYVMPNGPNVNAVSVGLYEQRVQAETRKAEIEGLGLGWPVRMEMQRKDESRYWLDFEVRGDAPLEIDQLVADGSQARQLEVPCAENEASFPPT